jgi:hypothetical protein
MTSYAPDASHDLQQSGLEPCSLSWLCVALILTWLKMSGLLPAALSSLSVASRATSLPLAIRQVGGSMY